MAQGRELGIETVQDWMGVMMEEGRCGIGGLVGSGQLFAGHPHGGGAGSVMIAALPLHGGRGVLDDRAVK